MDPDVVRELAEMDLEFWAITGRLPERAGLDPALRAVVRAEVDQARDVGDVGCS